MNLGKFNSAMWKLHIYFESNSILPLFDALIAALQIQISSPSTDSVINFRAALDTFLLSVRNVPEFSHLKSFQEAITDTGSDDLFGEKLEHRIKEIIQTTSFTPSEMLQSFTKLRTELSTYIANVNTLALTLDAMNVEYDLFHEDEFEFSALLPKELVGITTKDLIRELTSIDRLFSALNELMGKDSLNPIVKTISSSWWQFFLDLDKTQIAAITFALERIVNLYKSSLEIQKLKRDAEKVELNPLIIEQINAQIETKYREGMKQISAEIKERFANNPDEARKNELEIQIRHELIGIAKKLNQGAIYEIKAALPEKPEESPSLTAAQYAQAISDYELKIMAAKAINSVNEGIVEISEGKTLDDMQLLTDYERLHEDEVH